MWIGVVDPSKKEVIKPCYIIYIVWLVNCCRRRHDSHDWTSRFPGQDNNRKCFHLGEAVTFSDNRPLSATSEDNDYLWSSLTQESGDLLSCSSHLLLIGYRGAWGREGEVPPPHPPVRGRTGGRRVSERALARGSDVGRAPRRRDGRVAPAANSTTPLINLCLPFVGTAATQCRLPARGRCKDRWDKTEPPLNTSIWPMCNEASVMGLERWHLWVMCSANMPAKVFISLWIGQPDTTYNWKACFAFQARSMIIRL